MSLSSRATPLLIAACALTAASPIVPAAQRDQSIPAAAAEQPRAPLQLTDGAASIDELLDRLFAALERSDVDALNQLRLSKDEYLQIIVPGNVPKGQAPLQTFEKNNQFFWSLLDTKSRMYAEVLMHDWGGRRFVERRVEFSEPKQEHDWYTAHGEVRVHLKDAASGRSQTLRSGWLAEVNGRWKFIGYEYDD